MKTACSAVTLLAFAALCSGEEVRAAPRDVARWLRELPHDARSSAEMGRFRHDGNALEESARQGLARGVRRLLRERVVEVVEGLAEGPCRPFVEASYPKPGFATGGEAPERKTQREFEAGFIRIEMLACLDASADPGEALDLYTSEAFRKSVSSRLVKLWPEDDGVCLETKGVWSLVAPTSSCNRISRYREGDVAAEHSQLVSNSGGEPFQHVYFKESVKTLVRTPTGLALHYLNYGRSVKLGSLKRALGTGRIRDAQKKAAADLERRLVADAAEE